MAIRAPDGTFVHGPETREYIGKLQRERYERDRAENPHPTEGRKRCTACKQWKYWNTLDRDASEFSRNHRHFKGGGERWYPSGKCKKCLADEAAARREVKKKEDPEGFKERDRRYKKAYRKRKGKAHIRKLSRESSNRARQRAGVPRKGPWKKYRNQGRGIRVDPKPFIEWLDEWLAATGTPEQTLCRRTSMGPEAGPRALRRWRAGEAKTADLIMLDEFFVAAGMQELLDILYPDT